MKTMRSKMRAAAQRGWPAILVAGFPCFVLPLVGCAPATVDKPLAQTLGGVEPEQQMEFWHQLAEQPITSYDDAFHALLIFTDGQDPSADYAGRVATMKERGLLAASFSAPANQAVDRGTLSVALARALKIRGGLVMRVFGPSPRYATKELEYIAIYPPSSPNQTFSGSEFLAVMSRAEDYQQALGAGEAPGGADYTPPELELRQGVELPPKPAPATEPAGAGT